MNVIISLIPSDENNDGINCGVKKLKMNWRAIITFSSSERTQAHVNIHKIKVTLTRPYVICGKIAVKFNTHTLFSIREI